MKNGSNLQGGIVIAHAFLYPNRSSCANRQQDFGLQEATLSDGSDSKQFEFEGARLCVIQRDIVQHSIALLSRRNGAHPLRRCCCYRTPVVHSPQPR